MKQLVFTKDSNIFLASADGTAARLLVTLNGKPQMARFSPDGTHIRFTLYDVAKLSSSLWEVGVDGKNPHSLLPGWRNPPLECCGEWTADGRYYLFLSGKETSNDVFALQDNAGFLRERSSAPVQLTAGPLIYNYLTPSTDGKKVFAQATLPRVQVVRYDPPSKLFVPYLAGLSATDLSFSRDGQWVAYVSIPDGSLWRSRIDGTDRMQLTHPPGRALLPIWSPDSSHIVYQTFAAGGGFKAQWISAQGGASEDLLPGGRGGVDFNFSPDGKSIIFCKGPSYAPTIIFSLDLKTREVSNFPGSEELFSPRYSPDGRYLAALSQDSNTLFLYDFASKKWNKWLTERGNIAYPTWSRDSKYVYFDNFMTDHPTARRVKVGDTQSEELFSLAALRRYSGTPSGTWGGLSPDGYRLYVEDTSVQEIYSLQLQ
jgi:Tol biopolymer transport system component